LNFDIYDHPALYDAQLPATAHVAYGSVQNRDLPGEFFHDGFVPPFREAVGARRGENGRGFAPQLNRACRTD
jgi:hypothetical protein